MARVRRYGDKWKKFRGHLPQALTVPNPIAAHCATLGITARELAYWSSSDLPTAELILSTDHTRPAINAYLAIAAGIGAKFRPVLPPSKCQEGPPRENPLAILCRQMGLDHLHAGRKAGVKAESAWQAMMEPNRDDGTMMPEAICALVKACEAMGLALRLARSPGLRIWIDRAHVDGLYHDDAFRATWNFPKLPKTQWILRQSIRKMRAEKLSFQRISDLLDRGHVCTLEGLPNWRKTTVKQIVDLRWLRENGRPLVPQAGAVERWRRWLMDLAMSQLCPGDAMAAVRYGIVWREEPDRILVTSSRPMPTKPYEWILAGLDDIRWIAGHWGHHPEESPAPPHGAAASAGG